jgi:hypothetical protein
VACFACQVRAEVLTNDSVVALVRAGLGPDAVAAKIATSATSFDLSTDALIALKQANVPDAVIAAMLQAKGQASVSTNAAGSSDDANPLAPHSAGIYVLTDWAAPPKMVRMDPSAGNQARTSNILGYAFTGGISSMKVKVALPNASARVKVRSSRPSFYFYFDQASASLSRGQSTLWSSIGLGAPVTSPNEFTLIRFEPKKGAREIVLGSFNIAGTKSGVADKARVSFTYEDVAPGVFKVTPEAALSPGEYGFVYSSTGGLAAAYTSQRVFDFSIVP